MKRAVVVSLVVLLCGLGCYINSELVTTVTNCCTSSVNVHFGSVDEGLSGSWWQLDVDEMCYVPYSDLVDCLKVKHLVLQKDLFINLPKGAGEVHYTVTDELVKMCGVSW